MDAFGKQALDAHNKYRAMHQVSPLTWSAELASGAQDWADHLAKTGAFQHAPRDKRSGTGENIFMMMGRAEITGDDATDSWYSEVKKYDFKKSGFQSGSGHFTQVVWKESKEFAIAKATKDRKVFVVARYKPAGNMMSTFDKNVFPEK